MFRNVIFIIASAVLLLNCANPFNQPPRRTRNDNYFKGAVITNYNRSGYATPLSDASMAEFRNTGGTWAGVLKTFYQTTLSSDSIFEDSVKTPDSSALSHAMTRAKGLGLKVFFVPHVDVKDGSWRRDIDPADRKQWFARYGECLKKCAVRAESLGVDLFSIGTEFKKISASKEWGGVIDTVRRYYSGPLTYCANWDEYMDFPHWDRLDYAGVDAYFPLASAQGFDNEERQANMERFIDQLGRWAGNRKVILTEIGFPSSDAADTEPWSWAPGASRDWERQAACYRIALETVPHREWFAGLFFWEWEAVTYAKTYDFSFNPRGKPAQEVLKEFWLK
jgi:hypothetical protein